MIFYQKELAPEITSKQLEWIFDNHAQKFLPIFLWLFDRNPEACLGKSFLSETISIGFSSGYVSCSFDNHNIFWNVKCFSAKSHAKIKVQIICQKIHLLNRFFPAQWKQFWQRHPKLFTNIWENRWSKS